MNILFYFDEYHKDVWSGRNIDYDIWFVFQAIWGVKKLAVIDQCELDLTTIGRENIEIYNTLDEFLLGNDKELFVLEHPRYPVDEMLDDHEFNEDAWYCIGPAEGWKNKNNYIGKTIGIEQEGNGELHAPFVGSVLSYKYFMSKQ